MNTATGLVEGWMISREKVRFTLMFPSFKTFPALLFLTTRSFVSDTIRDLYFYLPKLVYFFLSESRVSRGSYRGGIRV